MAALPAGEVLVVADVAAWREWLLAHGDDSDGVWLTLAKKGTVSPTSLRYDEALEEALCSGWIDGPKRGIDDAVFGQRFTPRRKASLWSTRNVGIVTALVEGGRMRDRGQAEIDRAKADGRWDRAYAGAASAEVPEDLAAALAASPEAAARFAELNRTNRYAVIHRTVTASPTARANRLAKLVALLAEGGAPYPQETTGVVPSGASAVVVGPHGRARQLKSASGARLCETAPASPSSTPPDSAR